MRKGLTFAAGVAVLLCAAGTASATNVTEFPDNGSEQFARGGAWIARATDPLAAFYNPAGLAGQDTRLLLQANINISYTCFQRTYAANDTTHDSLVDPAGGNYKYPRVCNDVQPFPNPQLGFTWRVSDRIGLGFLPLLAPSGVGSAQWPEFVDGKAPNQPAPNRYLLLNSNTVLLTPTIGAGFEVADGLRLGASFQWGIAAKVHFETAAMGVNGDNTQPQANDIKAALDAQQLFIPGFTLGALWSPTDDIDIAGWYKWSAPIDAKGDITTSVNYFTSAVANGQTGGVVNGTSSSCGAPCGNGNNAEIKVAIPMEAKLAFRYHKARAGEENGRRSHHRDPLTQDLFDAEVDLTWANNSTFDAVQVRFPGDPSGNGTIPVNGIPGSSVPPNADIPAHYNDVFGIRIGGDYNAIPDKLAIRAGGFYESKGQDDQYQSLAFSGAWRFGVAAGATYRMRFHPDDSARKNGLEFSLGYGHVFYGVQDNNQPCSAGIPALAGSPTNTSTPGSCSQQAAQKYRSNWPINLGTITNSLNVINVGVAYRF